MTCTSMRQAMQIQACLDVVISPAVVMIKFQYNEPCSFSVARLAVKNPAAITVHNHALTCK